MPWIRATLVLPTIRTLWQPRQNMLVSGWFLACFAAATCAASLTVIDVLGMFRVVGALGSLAGIALGVSTAVAVSRVHGLDRIASSATAWTATVLFIIYCGYRSSAGLPLLAPHFVAAHAYRHVAGAHAAQAIVCAIPLAAFALARLALRVRSGQPLARAALAAAISLAFLLVALCWTVVPVLLGLSG